MTIAPFDSYVNMIVFDNLVELIQI